MNIDNPRVLVLLAEGAEEMEVTIIVDVLRRGGIEVVLAGIDGSDPVTCSRGVRLVPDCALDGTPGEFDILVLPGGLEGTRALAGSARVGERLRRQVAEGRQVAAICAAPLALAEHGIGAGQKMTCHPSVEEVVGAHGVWTPGSVVQTPGLITSRGPGTAFEFALVLVSRLCGPEISAALRGPMML
jgi:DJ-1 family protein